MNKKIASIITAMSFILTSCSLKSSNNDTVLKTENNPAESINISESFTESGSQELKRFHAEDLNIPAQRQIGIYDGSIFEYDFKRSYHTQYKNLNTDETGYFSNGMVYISDINTNGSKICLYGCDDSHRYYIDIYDNELSSFSRIVCDDYFSDELDIRSVCIGLNDTVYISAADTEIGMIVFWGITPDGTVLYRYTADQIPESKDNYELISASYTSSGYYCVILSSDNEYEIHILDRSFNYLTSVSADGLTCPDAVTDLNGKPCILDYEYSEDKISYSFYQIDLPDNPLDVIYSGSQYSLKYISSIDKCDWLTGMTADGKIGYINNERLFSFDIRSSASSEIISSDTEDISAVFYSGNDTFVISSQNDLFTALSRTNIEDPSDHVEYILDSVNGNDTPQWIRILSSGHIQLAFSSNSSDNKYDFYEIDIDGQSHEKTSVSYEEGYISNAIITDNGFVYSIVKDDPAEILCFCDKTGNQINTIEYTNKSISDIVSYGNYVIVSISEFKDNNLSFSYDLINTENYSVSSETTNVPYRFFCSKDNYDFIGVSSDNIFGLNLSEHSKTTIMDLSLTNLPEAISILGYDHVSEDISYISDNDTVYKLSSSEDNGGFFVKADNCILNIGYMYSKPDSFLISEFEKKFPEYQVNLIDYSSQENDLSSALNKSLITGDIPDLFCFSSDDIITLSLYNDKNVFEDLYKFLSNDSELKKEDLLDNILNALEYNNSLYQITPQFSLLTILTDSEELFSKENWSPDEFIDFYKNNRNNTFYSNDTSFIKIANNSKPFINYNTRKTKFNSDAFKEIQSEYKNIINGSQMPDTDFRLHDTVIFDFNELNYSKNGVFKCETIHNIGYPGIAGNGCLIQPSDIFSVSAQSSKKEIAWEFIKCAFDETFFYNNEYILFPVRKDLLETMKEKTASEYAAEEKIGAIEYAYDMNGNQTELSLPDEEILDQTMDIITGAAVLNSPDIYIDNIYFEEFSKFIEDSCTVDEMCSSIEKRADIYLNELY